jgi:hypothetical protein
MTTSKPRKKRVPANPRCLEGSLEARRVAVVLLEVLSGAKGPQEGSENLGISLNRYYQIETRGLQGLIASLEPRPRGKVRTPERKLELAEADSRRLKSELSRHQALLRAAQRSLGLKVAGRRKLADGTDSKTGKKRRRRVATARATKVIAALRPPSVEPPREVAS